MKRTTLKLDDAVLRRLKRRAADEGRSLQDVANDALRQGLDRDARAPFKLKLRGWKAELRAGVDVLDRHSLLDLLDQN